jgi:hypothetical protein
MRTYPKIDEAEIAARKRLRPLFTKLADLAKGGICEREHAVRLGAFMDSGGFVYGDLVALRQRPHHWDRFQAEQWAWFLHRVMNSFSDDLAR